MKIRVINGPNLNLLGKREVNVYGSENYDVLVNKLHEHADKYQVEIEILQSNYEGQIVDWIQDYESYDALIINPAGYSHTSIAIMDSLLAVSGFEKFLVEVHISNIYARENFRQNSMTARACNCVISGCGLQGYLLALDYIVNQVK